ncbi:MAG: type II secretion system protein [Planctomycetota bacterium]|nr:type II secretion system protein [Planctomycetota bacterium]
MRQHIQLGRAGNARAGSVVAGRRAFTLMELLIVIGVIALLAGIAIVVGGTVVRGSKQSLTENTIRVLDLSLDAYIADKGSSPPAFVRHPDPTIEELIPVADAEGSGANSDSPIPALSWYLIQIKEVPAASKVLDQLNPKLVTTDQVPGASGGFKGTFRTVVDAWGNPIRYVHPLYSGIVEVTQDRPQATATLLGPARTGYSYRYTEVLRTPGNSDAGRVSGQRPYFYSAGEDGRPETTEDNVYTQRPDFVKR